MLLLAYMEPDRLSKRYRKKRSTANSFSEEVLRRSKRAIPHIIYPEILVIVDYDGYRLHGGDNTQVIKVVKVKKPPCKEINGKLKMFCWFNPDQTVFCIILEWCWFTISLIERPENSYQYCRHYHITGKYSRHFTVFFFLN